MSAGETWWNRFGPLSGVLFVATTFAGLLLGSYGPISLGPESSAGAIADLLTSIRARVSFGVSLALVGTFFFLWFLSYLRERVEVLDGGKNRFSNLVFGAGLVITALVLVYTSVGLAGSVPLSYGTDTQVAKTFFVYSWDFAEVLAPGVIAMISGVTAASLGSKVSPRWFRWFGLAFTIISFVLFPFVPGFTSVLFLIWVLVVSIMLYSQGRKSASSATIAQYAADTR